jgi:hypothetical protein
MKSEAVVANFKIYQISHLKGLRKPMKNLSQNILTLGKIQTGSSLIQMCIDVPVL